MDGISRKQRLLKIACYASSFSMAASCNLPPLLFLTFRELYGISYSLLGTLVVINFLTQLIIDLVFAFFSHRFNVPRTVKAMPYIAAAGLLFYALAPIVFPNAVYLGLLLGTVIFSVASGLGEVLVSPVFATVPAKDPDREMSKLHSCYAWGTVGVIILSTLYLYVFKGSAWQYLAVLFALMPLSAAVLFTLAQVPDIPTPKSTFDALGMLKSKMVWLSVFAIFLGGASECNMAQWASTYLEQALGIPKIWGDVFGVSAFALFLGLGRTLYAKLGRSIERILLLSAIGASACYVIAAISSYPPIGLFACAFTGFCTAMLWPGNLVVAEKRFPQGGVLIFALMAAGGDMGASVAPQLVGAITDGVIASPTLNQLALDISLTPEQLGMKIGLLIGALFPIVAIFVQRKIKKTA